MVERRNVVGRNGDGPFSLILHGEGSIQHLSMALL